MLQDLFFTKKETNMEYNLLELATWLNKNNLMQKPFASFSQDEIETLCEAVHLVTIPIEYRLPYLKNGELIFPTPTHPRFQYWADGQSLFKTLKEMGADPETIERYCPKQDREDLSKNINKKENGK